MQESNSSLPVPSVDHLTPSPEDPQDPRCCWSSVMSLKGPYRMLNHLLTVDF